MTDAIHNKLNGKLPNSNVWLFPCKMKARTSTSQRPAKHLSLLKGTIHSQRAHISSGFLPILVLSFISLSPRSYGTILYLMSHCRVQSSGREWPAILQLLLKYLAVSLSTARSSFSTLCGQKKALWGLHCSFCHLQSLYVGLPYEPDLFAAPPFYAYLVPLGLSRVSQPPKKQQTIH